MKLLLDQNLSYRLVSRLVDVWPETSHVSFVGLASASDNVVWDYARANGYVIVSKDSDFNERSVLYGTPPKVLWLRVRNSTTDRVEATLRAHLTEIQAFVDDPILGVLELF